MQPLRELHLAFGALVLCAALGFSQEALVRQERVNDTGLTESFAYGFGGVRYSFSAGNKLFTSHYDEFSKLRERINPEATKQHRFMQRAGALFWLFVISFVIALPYLVRRFSTRQRAGFLLLSAGLGLSVVILFRASVAVDPFSMAQRAPSGFTLLLTPATWVMVGLWALAIVLAGRRLVLGGRRGDA